jgi:hypothetical protein
MMFRAAVAFLALALPAFAQHGGSHAGSSGSRGFSGNAGFSSHPAFSQPAFSRPAFSQSPNFARPAQPARYGPSYGPQYRPMPNAGYPAASPAGIRSPYTGNRYIGSRYNGSTYNGNRQSAARAPYNSSAAGLSRGPDTNHDRDRFDARRRQFQNWYANTYPYWSGYPYLLNPNLYNLGLYDWSDSDDSAPANYESDSSQPGGYVPGSYESDQAPESYLSDSYLSDQNGPALDYPPYPNQAYAAPNQIASAAPPSPAQPLTVIFKSGRSPIEIQNYMMTAKVLTDLDSEHYEQIPLNEINLAATQNFNKVAGVDFQVPIASRD